MVAIVAVKWSGRLPFGQHTAQEYYSMELWYVQTGAHTYLQSRQSVQPYYIRVSQTPLSKIPSCIA